MKKAKILKAILSLALVLTFLSSCGSFVSDVKTDIFSFKLLGDIYKVPMSASDFLAKGWKLDSSSDFSTVEANDMGYAYFYKNNVCVIAYFSNSTEVSKAYSDCDLISLVYMYGDINVADASLSGNLTAGKATYSEVTSTLGDDHSPKEFSDDNEKYFIEYESAEVDSSGYRNVLMLGFDGQTDIFNTIVLMYSSASDEEEVTDPVTSEATVTTTAPNYTTKTAPVTELGDSWNTFRFEMFGEIYQLPMLCSDFLAKGWTLGSNSKLSSISARHYDDGQFYKNNIRVTAYLNNYDISAKNYSECYVTGIQYSYGDGNVANFVLPGNITAGKSTYDDVVSAYGDNHTEKKESSGTYYIYYYSLKDGQTNSDESLYFDFNSQTNIIDCIMIRCKTEPENVVQSKASTEPFFNYSRPTTQSTNIDDAVFSYDGKLYKFPCPLSEFLSNGWTIYNSEYSSDKYDENTVLSGSHYCSVDLAYKDDYNPKKYYNDEKVFNSYLYVIVNNTSDSANILKNCIIKDIKFDIRNISNADAFSKKIGFAFPLRTKAELEKSIADRSLNFAHTSETKDGVAYDTYSYGDKYDDVVYLNVQYTNGTLSYFEIKSNIEDT